MYDAFRAHTFVHSADSLFVPSSCEKSCSMLFGNRAAAKEGSPNCQCIQPKQTCAWNSSSTKVPSFSMASSSKKQHVRLRRLIQDLVTAVSLPSWTRPFYRCRSLCCNPGLEGYVHVRCGACFLTFLTSSGTASQFPSQRASSSCWIY
mgnify:CR=1 FL=1